MAGRAVRRAAPRLVSWSPEPCSVSTDGCVCIFTLRSSPAESSSGQSALSAPWTIFSRSRMSSRRRSCACCRRRSAWFFSSRRRHTIFDCDWSSDVCSSDLHFALHALDLGAIAPGHEGKFLGRGGHAQLSEQAPEVADPLLCSGQFRVVSNHGLTSAKIGRAPCRERG